MGEVGADNQVVGGGACPTGQEAKTIGQKIYCIGESIGARKTNSVMVMSIVNLAYISLA